MDKNAKDSRLKEAYAKLKATHAQIKETYEDMMIRLAIAVEYKDTGIGGHIMRVSDYSTAIARSLRLPENEVTVIRYASMMHDMGKIGISELILDKEAALAPEEHKKIEQHALIGSKIFSGSKYPMVKAAGEIALTHHERYDGTGYPRALKGDKIPLYGRIVALADFFDAFVSKRSYKPAHSFDEAVKAVKERIGTYFDPDIVMAFLKAKDVIRKIFAANITIEDFIKKGS